jgi:hypothetical protein
MFFCECDQLFARRWGTDRVHPVQVGGRWSEKGSTSGPGTCLTLAPLSEDMPDRYTREPSTLGWHVLEGTGVRKGRERHRETWASDGSRHASRDAGVAEGGGATSLRWT